MNQLTVLQLLSVLNRHRFNAFAVWFLVMVMFLAAFLVWPRAFSSEGKIYVQLGRIATEISPSSGSKSIQVQDARESEVLAVVGSVQQSDQDVIEFPFDDFSKPYDAQSNDFTSVVFDLPVANHLTTFHAIAPHLDGVLLTVESNQIEPRLVERFRRQLDVRGVPIVGLVINKS